MERERKFLITRPPAGLAKYPHRRIRQGYLAIPGGNDQSAPEIRVRDDDGRHVLTLKAGHGASRTEVELPIDDKAFRHLWRLTAGKRIEKVRYRIPLGDLTAELDIYHGKLRGLRTAEVEFASNSQLRRFRPPDWLGQEVTGQDVYGNSRLATADKPPRGREGGRMGESHVIRAEAQRNRARGSPAGRPRAGGKSDRRPGWPQIDT